MLPLAVGSGAAPPLYSDLPRVDHASIAPDFPQGAFSDYLSVPRAFTTARRAGYFP